MRFALRCSAHVEAKPGADGRCPGCEALSSPAAALGNVRHWAHRGRRHCGLWWENETDWHRAWKAHFPLEWQEIPARDAFLKTSMHGRACWAYEKHFDHARGSQACRCRRTA